MGAGDAAGRCNVISFLLRMGVQSRTAAQSKGRLLIYFCQEQGPAAAEDRMGMVFPRPSFTSTAKHSGKASTSCPVRPGSIHR
ncbi:hypothetical protein GDO81_027423 [Engystomops pustulosus]|uniref:Uncharacterized protein n=1 Tax=Engystomops pustulosus TaxID=76066 RepID=A0AAV6YEH3_ENGPU|nr:hypothetical protein GDO81_027423 [Engystomops pustulosus]